MTTQPGGLDSEYQSTDVLSAQTGDQPTVVYVREPTERRWGRRLLVLVGVIGVIAALVFGLKAIDIFPNFRNPFATETTDHSGPVLLESMQDLSRYVAAEGNFMVPVDIQESKGILPSWLAGQRTLFIGAGTVDAYVDFSKLAEGSIKVSPDGKSVEITLPQPQLEKPSLDLDRSYVFAQDRGLIDRVGDIFGGNPNDKQQLYQLAEQKIAEAAASSPLLDRAKKNTQAMLESMLHQLGFERVTILWGPQP
jgi:hypothetical protein